MYAMPSRASAPLRRSGRRAPRPPSSGPGVHRGNGGERAGRQGQYPHSGPPPDRRSERAPGRCSRHPTRRAHAMTPPDAEVSRASTRDLDLAAYWIARGLEFVMVQRVPGMPDEYAFIFADTGRAQELRAAFFGDAVWQARRSARRDLVRALRIARSTLDGRCTATMLAGTG